MSTKIYFGGIILQRNCERSNGTLLPLPALYLFGPALNSLGFGSSLSGWKRHLESSILMGPFLLGEMPSLGELLRWFEFVPLDKV